MSETKPVVVLTDPKPLPKDARCPQCDAKADRRIDGGGFGPKRIVMCGRCGYEFA